ncbi:MAG: allantoinase AllB [Planctomycetota bacterium]
MPRDAVPSDAAPDRILSSRRVVTPAGEVAASIAVREGRIVEVGGYDPAAGEDFGDDFGDLVLLPGLVDPHVHLNEPGRTEWEGFATGTAAAAAGGVTTLVDMPLNSSPVTTTVAALDAKRAAAAGKLSVDVGFHAGLVPGNGQHIAPLVAAGVLGVKAFLCHSGIDEFPAATQRELRAAMPLLAERGVPLLAHAELVHPTPPPADPRRYADYAASRPPSYERDAIALLIDLCRETGCRTHVVHLADAGSLPMLAAARADGLPLTVETCPHYLTFAAEEIADGATEYKCAPPIRDAANREALWQGLADGVIDFIASDHSPCPPAMKHQDDGRFDLAWGGISSLQLTLPVVWTEASRRGHTLAEVVDWLCHRPAELVGVAAGVSQAGPANLVVFDPEAEFVVRGDALHHRHTVTPYDGRTLRGVVRQTLVRGEPASPAASPGRGRAL